MVFFDMKKELTFALNYALNKGFQIHPDAFKILENVDVRKLEKIIKEIVREKTKQKLFQINQDDLETYLGIKEYPSIQSEVKVLSDPTSKIKCVFCLYPALACLILRLLLATVWPRIALDRVVAALHFFYGK